MNLVTMVANDFIARLEMAFVNRAQLEELVKLEPHCPILVRCGCGRFQCAAQDAAHFIEIIGKENSDYVRDVSVCSERWHHAKNAIEHRRRMKHEIDIAEYSGVFDGSQIISDADPGL